MFAALNLDPNEIGGLKTAAAKTDHKKGENHPFGYYMMPKYKIALDSYMNSDHLPKLDTLALIKIIN